AVAKLAGPLGLSWMTGQALRSQMAVDALRKELLGVPPNPVSYMLYDWLGLFSLLAVGSFALEFFAPLALLNKRLGRLWAVSTFFMHWGILFVMHITFRYHLSGVLFEDGKPYVGSTATLRVCRRLAGPWPLLYALILIPKQWRDAAYALVARNRKRWFKARPACPVMPPERRRRFIG